MNNKKKWSKKTKKIVTGLGGASVIAVGGAGTAIAASTDSDFWNFENGANRGARPPSERDNPIHAFNEWYKPQMSRMISEYESRTTNDQGMMVYNPNYKASSKTTFLQLSDNDYRMERMDDSGGDIEVLNNEWGVDKWGHASGFFGYYNYKESFSFSKNFESKEALALEEELLGLKLDFKETGFGYLISETHFQVTTTVKYWIPRNGLDVPEFDFPEEFKNMVDFWTPGSGFADHEHYEIFYNYS